MRNLQPSLITSYNLSGILGPDECDFSAFRNASSGVMDVGADLYLLMEPDVRKWCERWNIGQLSAVDFLAQLDTRMIEFCESLKAKFQAAGVEVVSATSFVPEISNKTSPGETRYAETSWGKAIVNIFRIADYFQSHRPQTVVQMVAGSLLDQFRVKKKDGAQRFSVSTRERAALISLVLDRLSQCLNKAQSNGVDTHRLKISLELEPGPLYLLQNKKSLEEFCSAIDTHECSLVKQCVGFNLDIAHWWLCRDLTTEHDVPDAIRRRIYGGHIAGHSPRGHFGDLSLTKLVERGQRDPLAEKQRQAYQMWLRFLADNTKTPCAAGHVSLEFEAAKPNEDVASSLRLLREWIDLSTQPQ